MVGRSKYACFQSLQERVGKRVKGWKERCLSKGGKEILLKAVAQAIPTYSMSCFKLPLTLCNELQKLMNKFWWADSTETKKIHWMSWDRLCWPKMWGGLGFRDLKSFNLAMLAKQCWRLIEFPRSLVARILKAKYFPNSTLLHAKASSSSSYTWKSMVDGLEVLKLGTLWRIGDGTEVDIWNDPWLMEASNFRPLMPPIFDVNLRKVNQLFLPGTRLWNDTLVRGIFSDKDADEVLSLRLSSRGTNDILFWMHEKNGQYTVKSGYKVLWQHQLALSEAGDVQLATTNQGSKSQSAYWKRLWKIQVPPRIKNFLWRVSRGILPTRERLLQKGIHISNGCSFCGASNETLRHILMECDLVQSVFHQLQFDGLSNIQIQDSWVHQLDSIFSGLSGDNQRLLSVIWDEIWMRRNQVWQAQQFPRLPDIISSILNRMKVLKEADTPAQELTTTNQVGVQWSRPIFTDVKINVDAALFEETRQCGVGIVVRDKLGSFVAARCSKIDNVRDPLHGEYIAALEGLKFAQELGFNKIHLEGDSAIVFESIKLMRQDRSYNGAILADIFDLASSFYFFESSYVSRKCNGVADYLANHARSTDFGSWFDTAPTFLLDALCKDCIN